MAPCGSPLPASPGQFSSFSSSRPAAHPAARPVCLQEEELRKSGEAKYFHLHDDLHVLIEVFAPPAEAYARMGHALEEIKKFLIPVSGLRALPLL